MAPIKQSLSTFVPPFAYRAFHKWRLGAWRRYPSWEKAVASAGSYDDEALTAFRLARHYLNNDAEISINNNPLNWLTALAGRPLAIVDFGGATGEMGNAIVKAHPGVTFTVVENPTLVAMAPAVEGVTFSSEMPDVFDVFYSSSTLQYLPDPYAILRLAFTKARKAVVLVRNSFSEREVFRVQLSRLFDHGWGKIPENFKNIVFSTPHRTLVEGQIAEIAAEHGFSCIYRALDTSYKFAASTDIRLVFLRNPPGLAEPGHRRP